MKVPENVIFIPKKVSSRVNADLGPKVDLYYKLHYC